MGATVVQGVEGLRALAGAHLGHSGWLVVDQERIDRFAEATGDHQWIHVDPVRAKDGPFGTTIAHGYLTLSLVPVLYGELLEVHGVSAVVNYGCNKVRFPAPVPAGSSIRLGAQVGAVEDVPGGVQVVADVEVQVRDAPKPSCVAQLLYRYLA